MRQIYANYDDEGIFVYQAFKPSTVEAALAKGTFGAGFSMERMTWIKPSFGWMLYRSDYASKIRQKATLKIKLPHTAFIEILSHSVETAFNPRLYADHHDWKKQLNASEVRHQWDPERHLRGHKLSRRAIQIGIRGSIVERYVNAWIIGLTEVTALAHEIQDAIVHDKPLPVVPEEKVYPVSPALVQRLGITD